jgi:hypothetical protein
MDQAIENLIHVSTVQAAIESPCLHAWAQCWNLERKERKWTCLNCSFTLNQEQYLDVIAEGDEHGHGLC